MKKADFEKIFESDKNSFLQGWKEFLSFESVSTDQNYSKPCLDCATWLVNELSSIGLKSELWATEGKPVVYGEYLHSEAAPTLLYYGHYDVQPVDPLELWRSDPFKPEIRDGRMFARGAQDNKGQTFYVLKAIETLIKFKMLKCNLKLLIEGEEESSSIGISRALSGWRDKLQADLLMVCDTGMFPPGIPSITMGLRGIIFLTAQLTGARNDLHSGVHGGVAPNPATEMARLINSLYKADGSIAIQGYYDGIDAIDQDDLRLANTFAFPPEMYMRMVGVEPCGGEKALAPIERRGFRPTVEINGISSGYSGEGSKTIIPSRAMVKITSRLVSGQDPARCLELIRAHLRRNAPKGLTLEIFEDGVGGPAVRASSKGPWVGKAVSILQQLGDGRVSHIWEGASIPIVAELVNVSGAEPVLVGFGSEEDSIHAPNESFSIEQFRQGFLYASLFIGSVGT